MKFKKKVLKNGIRVITIPMPESLTATVLVLVEAGSEYETKDVNGISHFLEHMCFKGTQKRPTALAISEELDGIGAQYNAFTGQEYTGYWAKAGFGKVGKLVDVVSDIYLNPVFDEGEIEKEKGVIIEEMNMYEDLPARNIQDLLLELLYGDQPAGWNVLGRKEVIKKITREDFLAYREKHYVASSTIVVVAGKFDEKKILNLVEKKFSKVSSVRKSKKEKTVENQKRPELLVKYKKTDQAHLVLAFRSFAASSAKSVPAKVLAGILGGGMSSRLFQKLREEMGVAYYVRAYNDASIDRGVFQMSAGVDVARTEEVVRAILEEARNLKKTLVSERELSKVKDFLIGNMYLELESSDQWADYYGLQEVFRKKEATPREHAAAIRKVTPPQIKRVANEIFTNDKLNLALIGPIRNKEKLSRVLKL